jgi:hypothetical protein
VAGEELLALIFEEVHEGRGLYKPLAARRRPAVKWHNARRMALPSKVNFVTFDVYGTLIDWEKGVFDAFQKEATRDGFTIEDPQEVISRFHEYEREIEGGSYELYAEVLRRVAVRIAKDIGWPLEPSRAGFLPTPSRAGRRSRRPTRS